MYVDRYFTSVRIIDKLHAKGLHGSGTLQKFKIPVACKKFVGGTKKRSNLSTYKGLM